MKRIFFKLLLSATVIAVPQLANGQCYQNGQPCGQSADAQIGSPAPTTGTVVLGTDGNTTTPILTDSTGRTITSVYSLPSLVAGNAVIGSIANTGFNITGSLPAFATVPTFNLGTLNGAATDTSVLSVKSTLGSPFQVGGTIGNTSFGATQSGSWTVGLTGTLPGFATTPTFNLGTLNGAATDNSVLSVKTTLGSPFQAGGSISNTSFGSTQNGTWNVGITGSLPGYASTPTFNLGTLNGAATDSSVLSVKTTLGSPFQVGGSIGNTTFGSTQSGTWNVGVTGTVTANLGTLNGAATDTSVQAVTSAINGTPGVKQADVYGTGSIASGTASAAYTVSTTNGASTGTFVTSGLTASAATLTPEGSYDGTNFVSIPVIQVGAKTFSSVLTADGQYRFNAAGRRAVRLRVTTAGSGTVTVISTISVAPFDIPSPTLDTNGNLTVNITSGSTVATTAVDGSSVTLGAKADAKCITTDTTACSMIGLLKGNIDRQGAIITSLGTLATATQLPASLGQKTAAASVSVTLPSDGVQAKTTDITALQTQLHTDLIAATPAGTNIIGNLVRTITFQESTAALAASGTFTGTSRDAGVLGTANPYNYFSCFSYSDQTNTLVINGSFDGTTYFTIAKQTVTAATPTYLSSRIFARYFQCKITNTTTTAETYHYLSSQLGQ